MTHFSARPKAERPNELTGQELNRLTEIQTTILGTHKGAYSPESFDAAVFDVTYNIVDRKIIKA